MSSNTAPPGRKQRVLVNVILDKSGSMASKAEDVLGGFNLFLDKLAKQFLVDYWVSLTLFDTRVELKYQAVPLAQVARLDETTYCPAGCTALLDAIGNTVQHVRADGFDKVIIVIMTDGLENSSREWSVEGIRALIHSKEAKGTWTFVFLGANLDAFAQGAKLGVAKGNSVRYDPANYRRAFGTVAEGTNRFSAGRARATVGFFNGQAAGTKTPDHCGSTPRRHWPN